MSVLASAVPSITHHTRGERVPSHESSAGSHTHTSVDLTEFQAAVFGCLTRRAPLAAVSCLASEFARWGLGLVGGGCVSGRVMVFIMFSMGRYVGAQQHTSQCSTIDADRAAFTIEAWMWKEEVELHPMV